MTAVPEMTNCPTAETLAAFVDGRLHGAARDEVIQHAADCADCRDVILLATEIIATEAPAPNVVRPRFGTKVWVPVAAAAAIAVVLFMTPIRERIFGGGMRDVASHAEMASERPSYARLSVDVVHKPAKVVFRSNKQQEDWNAKLVAAEAADRAAKNPSVENLHALSVASTFSGDRKTAVEALEQALRKAKTPTVALLNDLTVAYLEAGQYADAWKMADDAWKLEKSPTTAWNRALALERLGHDAKAIEAWQRYMEMETDPAWDAEAQQRIDKLR